MDVSHWCLHRLMHILTMYTSTPQQQLILHKPDGGVQFGKTAISISHWCMAAVSGVRKTPDLWGTTCMQVSRRDGPELFAFLY